MKTETKQIIFLFLLFSLQNLKNRKLKKKLNKPLFFNKNFILLIP